MIKRTPDYWLRSGTPDELFEYLQILVVKDVISHQPTRSFGDETDAEDDRPRPAGDFQNLMPIINSSSSESDYLHYVLSFITNNLTDLSALTSFLDISKFRQQRRLPLVEEFTVDKNLMEVVDVATA